MRKVWNICRFEIQRVFKERQSYLIMFAMPLIFTLLFGTLMGSDDRDPLAVTFVDEDKSLLSKSLFEELHEKNALFTLEKGSNQDALTDLDNKKIVGVIHVGKGFEAKMLEEDLPNVRFEHIPEFTTPQTITGYLSNKLSKLNIEMAGSLVWSEQSGEDWKKLYGKLRKESATEESGLKQVTLGGGQVNEQGGFSSSASGFSIMFLMITMMSVTGTILEARSNGVWYRLLSTPASRFEIAFGYLLSFFMIGWIQFGILMLATSIFFDVSWGNPIYLVLLVSAMLFAIVGLGLMISGFVKTVEQQSAIGNLVVISTCMIAGVYWPLEIEPAFMQKMAEFLPQRWAMKGLTDIAGNGSLPIESIAILLLFGLVFLLLGIRRIRFE
ncbi:ABC transporter permease [Peribacillus sp. NPDC097225]|uniref:ABC transporter permease n=1 Tax=Peribacillus sp. NPDC097225 TaxID=3364400 RepID=UPI00382ACCB2